MQRSILRSLSHQHQIFPSKWHLLSVVGCCYHTINLNESPTNHHCSNQTLTEGWGVCGKGRSKTCNPSVLIIMSSYISKVIPLVRARSSSPVVFNPIIAPATTAGSTVRARTPPLRSLSSLSISGLPSGSDHGSDKAAGTRGYATAFAGLNLCGTATINAAPTGIVNLSGTRALARSMSDEVAVPEPPFSNHPHKAIPGASGQLIYTET